MVKICSWQKCKRDYQGFFSNCESCRRSDLFKHFKRRKDSEVHPKRARRTKKWPSSRHLPAWKLPSPWSQPRIGPDVPCKPPVTQNKLPSLWMGQNNTEMSLFRRNWSYHGKHKSIVSIIVVSPAPQRFIHQDSFASFHLPTDYYFHVSYFWQSSRSMLNRFIFFYFFYSLQWVFVWHIQYNTPLYFSISISSCSSPSIQDFQACSILAVTPIFWMKTQESSLALRCIFHIFSFYIKCYVVFRKKEQPKPVNCCVESAQWSGSTGLQ